MKELRHLLDTAIHLLYTTSYEQRTNQHQTETRDKGSTQATRTRGFTIRGARGGATYKGGGQAAETSQTVTLFSRKGPAFEAPAPT